MRIAALDIGDVWTGIALSDPLKILAKPHETIKAHLLPEYLAELIAKQRVSTIVVGHPRTLKGTSSEQTKKVEEVFEKLKQMFPHTKFLLFDERLTSKQADALKRPVTQEEKIHAHSVAAAFILQTYLQSIAMQQEE